MNNEPRAYTSEEVRNKLLAHIRMMVKYWADDRVLHSTQRTTERRLEGLAFSILAMLDGCSNDLPAFTLIPSPHPDDKQYHIENDENWFESEPLNFMLHEFYYEHDQQ
jgi:hypothetical protein